MREIYRSGDLAKIGPLAGRLRAEGVDVYVQNENLSVTEAQIPPFSPAIFILKEEDEKTALKFLRIFLEKEERSSTPNLTDSAHFHYFYHVPSSSQASHPPARSDLWCCALFALS